MAKLEEEAKGAVQRDPGQVKETEWENKCTGMHQKKNVTRTYLNNLVR